MKKSDIWIPIYIGDLLADTQHLSNEQFGIYHRVLYHQWRHGHFSSDDLFALAGFTAIFESASSTAQVEAKQRLGRVLAAIQHLLSKDEGGLWFSRRCDIEKEKWTHKKEVFTERARKGGLAKAKVMRAAAAEKAASSSASSVLEHVLEGCTSSSDKEPKSTPPTPPPLRQGGPDAAQPGVLQAARRKNPASIAPNSLNGKRSKSETPSKSPRTHRQRQGGGKHPKKSAASVAPPPNFVAPEISEGVRPSKTDPRERAFQSEVFAYWRGQNPEHPNCPWGEPESRALRALLIKVPDLSLEQLRQALRNRAASGIPPGVFPGKWLRNVLDYSDGPLDRFHRPLRTTRVM